MRVEVQWSPACELLTSLRAYVVRPDIKLLQLGRDWRAAVQGQLSNALERRLEQSDIAEHLGWFELLVWHCPDQTDSGVFVRWLSGLSTGDLLGLFLPHTGPDELASVKRLLEEWDPSVDLLTSWEEAYFRSISSDILSGLDHAAAAAREIVAGAEPRALVEAYTNGLFLEPGETPDTVVIGPQYHCVPLNVVDAFAGLMIIRYPVDPIVPQDDAPPPHILRLTRALSDENRMRILLILAQHDPMNLTQVAEQVGLAISTAHHHLVVLRTAGLVRIHHRVRSASTYSLRRTPIETLGTEVDAYLTRSPSRSL